MSWLLYQTELPLLTLVAISLAVFYLGYLTGKYTTKGLSTNPMRFSLSDWTKLGVVLLTFIVFVFFMMTLYTQIFLDGLEVPISLMVMGIYSFGSLVGEKDFLTRVIDKIRK